MKRFLIFLLILSFYNSTQSQPSFIKDSIDEYINVGIKDWKIPGLALTIVHNGEVVLSKGYGVRNILTKEPVDENTFFIIASNSKLFTATALAKLEFDKKLSLDDKITKYFPDFKLYNSTSTSLVTIKDMLSHHIGTKTFQGDFTFWNSALSRSQVMYKMRFLKPLNDFRTSYGYCNSCFLTAGEIIPKVTNFSWEKFVYDSLVTPLNMFRTKTLTNQISKLDNIASPYTNSFTGLLTQLPFDNVDNMAPATSMVSCVKDLSNWLMMQLDSGRLFSKQILPWQVVSKTRDMVTPISSKKRGAIHFTGYGLGLFMSDYYGKQIFNHTGGADGFVTNTCFIPEINLGISILTNNDNQNFFEILRWQIIDAYLNIPFNNRSKQQLPNFIEENEKQLNEIKSWKGRIVNNKPKFSLQSYVGKYENELYGTIDITAVENNLKIKFNSHNNLFATMQYMDKDEWMITYNPIMLGIFSTKFEVENNKVKSVKIKVSDFVEYDPYIFKKIQ